MCKPLTHHTSSIPYECIIYIVKYISVCINSHHTEFVETSEETCTGGASPQSVGSEGGVRVDVVMQPPLHCHVPVAHAVSHLHAEVSVVAVDVLNGSEVVRLGCGGIRAEVVPKTKRYKTLCE